MASQLHPGLPEAVGGPQENECRWLGREKPGAGVWLSPEGGHVLSALHWLPSGPSCYFRHIRSFIYL